MSFGAVLTSGAGGGWGAEGAGGRGTHYGRPRKDTANKALVAARALLDQGGVWRAVAEAMDIQKDSLRNRLHEAVMLAQNPTLGEVA